MNRFLAFVGVVLLVAGCTVVGGGGSAIAEFWRPVSEPNVLLPAQKAQAKLAFDLSQCNCGMFPSNASQPDLISFQPDQQRYIETSVFRAKDGHDGDCTQKPSLVVGECMRMRGWEPTTCSGRMPLAAGGSTCAGAVINN